MFSITPESLKFSKGFDMMSTVETWFLNLQIFENFSLNLKYQSYSK